MFISSAYYLTKSWSNANENLLNVKHSYYLQDEYVDISFSTNLTALLKRQLNNHIE